MAIVRVFSRLALTVSTVVLLTTTSYADNPQAIVEPNVNMVAGTEWPGGDPYLQRQNEGSVAISTRNPLVLLGAANDYRTVDVPFDPGIRPDDEQTGDAWIGIFQSRDGGRTWRSVMLDGYPQQAQAKQALVVSPLHGYQAAADPVVRAADHGLFYVAGIVLNRGTNPLGGVFVARFIHNNNTETGDPSAYLDTKLIDAGTSGQFIDKSWLAVAKQTNGTQCTVNGQTFAAQNVYLAYTVFVGGDNNIRTKMMFTRSTDCGGTWATPIKLSEGYAINQGASISVDPTSGNVYVLWRRFKSNNEADSILIAKSTDQGKTFSKGAVVVNIDPFEQGTTPASIRTNAYPSTTVDSNGRLYLVWQQRSGPAGYGLPLLNDGRIMIMNSLDGVNWTPPVQVDSSPTNGHQFQPTILATGNKLTVAYYDLREDSTLGGVQADGTEKRAYMGDLPGGPQFVFTTYLQELAHHRRHTLDVRAAQAATGASPVFGSIRVSRYVFGNRPMNLLPTGVCAQVGMIPCLEQMQLNPPNFPLFQGGTVPNIGDYIDIAGYAGSASVQHIVWTDNRDVRPPLDGDWTHYTAVGVNHNRVSIFNGQPVPDCIVGQTGMRNQNIYTTRLTEGLFAGAANNFKQLNILRAFAIFMQNAKKQDQSYHLVITAPGGTIASFLQNSVQTTLDITVTARSTATRTVFVAPNPANPHASVSVTITESGTATPLFTTVVLNPDVSNPDVSNPDVSNSELHNPDVSNPDVSNPDVSNGNFQTPDVSNPDVSNPDVSNPDVSNPDVSNPDVSNPDVSNPDVSNPDVSNPDVSNSSLTDTTWEGKNNGKTTTGYNVKLVSNGPPAGIKTQLLINRLYQTPVARNCVLGVESQRQIVANIPNPKFSDGGDLFDPLAKEKEGTYWLAPGDSIRITLRVFDPNKNDNITFDPATDVQLTVISQAINTNGEAPPLSVGLAITTKTLPAGVVGQPYQIVPIEGPPFPVTLQAVGGVGNRTWAAVSGLPAGLSISPSTGTITGSPTTAGDSTATFSVTDSAVPPHVAQRTFLIHITAPPSLTFNNQPQSAVSGSQVSADLVVTAKDGQGAVLPGVQITLSAPKGPCQNSIGGLPKVATTDEVGQAHFGVLTGSRACYDSVLTATATGFPSAPSTSFDVFGFGDFTSLNQARVELFTVTQLTDGRILITGGRIGATSSSLSSAEVYDPSTQNFRSVANMGTARRSHSATLLPDGRVLIAGGFNADGSLTSLELFDPATETFSPAGDLAAPRGAHTATLMPDGSVLFVGGIPGALKTCERFTPAPPPGTGTVTSGPTLNYDRSRHTATLLSDGRLVIIGGGGTEDEKKAVETLTGDAFVLGGTINEGRSTHTATLLADGQILLTGGTLGLGPTFAISTTSEIYNPTTNTTSALITMVGPHWAHFARRLDDGNVAMGGGYKDVFATPSDQVEVFDVATSTFLNYGQLPATGLPMLATAPLPTSVPTKFIALGGTTVVQEFYPKR